MLGNRFYVVHAHRTIDFQWNWVQFIQLKLPHRLFHFYNYWGSHYSMIVLLLYICAYSLHTEVSLAVLLLLENSMNYHIRVQVLFAHLRWTMNIFHIYLNICCWCCFFFFGRRVFIPDILFGCNVHCLVCCNVVNMIYGVTFMSMAHSIYVEDGCVAHFNNDKQTKRFTMKNRQILPFEFMYSSNDTHHTHTHTRTRTRMHTFTQRMASSDIDVLTLHSIHYAYECMYVLCVVYIVNMQFIL